MIALTNLTQRSVLVLGAALLSTTAAQAQQQVCFTDVMPTTTTNWMDTLTVQRFDPNLGDLVSVTVTLSGDASGSAAFESLDALPATVTLNYSATLTLFRPNGGVSILNIVPATQFLNMASAADGTIDFGGTAGDTVANINVMDSDTVMLNSAMDLALFTGPAGAPGSIVLPIDAIASSTATGAGNLITQFMTSAGASVEVCYNYELGDVKCNGDGGDQMGCTDCPCNNNAPAGTVGGCLNSASTSAALMASGTPSVSNDTLQFTATGAVAGATGILFSGSTGLPTNPMNPCTGTDSGVTGTFFDGLRCLGGTIRRHPARMSDANGDFGVVNAPWGPPGNPIGGLIARGGWMAGQTTCWQVYYRDTAGPCGTGVNSTNAVVVTIVP